MNISSLNPNNFVNLLKRQVSFGRSNHHSELERSHSCDYFECEHINIEKKKFSQEDMLVINDNLEKIKKNGLLSEEILSFLEPKKDSKGKPIFSVSQANVIYSLSKKVTFFKSLARRLEEDGKEYGEACAEQIRGVFGGKKGLGKYVVYRTKDATSIFNKLVKEFNENKVPEILDIIAQRNFKVSFYDMDDEDIEYMKMAINEDGLKLDAKDYRKMADIFKTNKKEIDESIGYVRDLVGTRLVLPNGSEEELRLVEKYITKAISSGKLQLTKVSNYHANHILPYIQHETAKLWKQLLPGLRVVETNQVRKKNGYTTTQMNLVHEIKLKNGIKKIFGELQIRTEELNFIGDVEHLIYDILQGKDITKGIPALKKYFEKTGIEKAVHEVFNDKEKEQAYLNYERAMYYYIRKKESDPKAQISVPRLHEYGLGKYWAQLSFLSLQRIDQKAREIKKEYYNELENK